MNELIDPPTYFWKSYLHSLPPEHPARRRTTPEAWSFGDSPEMANRLGELVFKGIKSATTSLLWEYEFLREQPPKVGDLSIILDGKGSPLCIIETMEVEIKPFDQVDERFAYDEGEGDRSLNYWQTVHTQFFNRACQQIGRSFSENMPVVCERFRVIYR